MCYFDFTTLENQPILILLNLKVRQSVQLRSRKQINPIKIIRTVKSFKCILQSISLLKGITVNVVTVVKVFIIEGRTC